MNDSYFFNLLSEHKAVRHINIFLYDYNKFESLPKYV